MWVKPPAPENSPQNAGGLLENIECISSAPEYIQHKTRVDLQEILNASHQRLSVFTTKRF